MSNYLERLIDRATGRMPVLSPLASSRGGKSYAVPFEELGLADVAAETRTEPPAAETRVSAQRVHSAAVWDAPLQEGGTGRSSRAPRAVPAPSVPVAEAVALDRKTEPDRETVITKSVVSHPPSVSSPEPSAPIRTLASISSDDIERARARASRVETAASPPIAGSPTTRASESTERIHHTRNEHLAHERVVAGSRAPSESPRTDESAPIQSRRAEGATTHTSTSARDDRAQAPHTLAHEAMSSSVHVHIGRIDVRATVPRPATVRASLPGRPIPSMTLDQYLTRRGRER